MKKRETGINSPVKGTSSTQGISPHLTPSQPITNFQPLWQPDNRPNAIDRITSRSPNTSFLGILVTQQYGQVDGKSNVGCRRERWTGSGQVGRNGEGVRVDDLVIKHDTVERTVYSVVDVVWAVRSVLYLVGKRLTHDICTFTFSLFFGVGWG